MPNAYIFALGFFDGVHLGHQTLLKECVRLATEYGAEPAAITFDAHPGSLFAAEPTMLLSSLADREALLKSYGIRYVHVLQVTKEVMSTPWERFLDQLRQLGAVGFVCGHDFRFGCGGEGNAQKLADYCSREKLPCGVVPEQTLEGVRLSSTHIRCLLETGETEAACRFLGHPHLISGEVVSGRKLGRTIGIPTANLALAEGVLCPRQGVYAGMVRIDGKRYPAVTNIGSRPTVGGHHVTVEPWILDFEGDLYGCTLCLELHKFLRPEVKFSSLEELKAEILKNAEQTRNFFGIS